MNIPTFIQNTRIGRTIFQVRNGFVVVSATRFGRPLRDYRIDLRSLDSNYSPRSVRVYSLWVIPLVIALLCMAVFKAMRHQNLVPPETFYVFYPWLAIGFGVSIFSAIQGTRRVEYFEFRNQWGKPALYLVRERKQAVEFTSFIGELVTHIELARSDLTQGDRNILLRQLEHAGSDTISREPGQDRWKMSLVLGSLATAIPLIPGMDQTSDPSVFPFIFLLCVGGLAAGTFSFLAKETRRWWSVPGMLLALIPVYLY